MSYEIFEHRIFKNEIENSALKWEESKAKKVKDLIKAHIYEQFNYTCFYCKLDVPASTSYVTIEHILDKNDFPQFAFHPNNLVLTCTKCNTEKGKSLTLLPSVKLIDNLYRSYPVDSKDFSIVHGYFDNYADHITYENDLFVKPINNSSKGKQTIKMCNLTRLEILEHKIKKSSLHSSSLIAETTLARFSSYDQYQNRIQNLTHHFDSIIEVLHNSRDFLRNPNISKVFKGFDNRIDLSKFDASSRSNLIYFITNKDMIDTVFDVIDRIIKDKTLKKLLINHLVFIGYHSITIKEFVLNKNLIDYLISNLDNRNLSFFPKYIDQKQLELFIRNLSILSNINLFVEEFFGKIEGDIINLINFFIEYKKINHSIVFWDTLERIDLNQIQDFNNNLSYFDVFEGYRENKYIETLKAAAYIKEWINSHERYVQYINKNDIGKFIKYLRILNKEKEKIF